MTLFIALPLAPVVARIRESWSSQWASSGRANWVTPAAVEAAWNSAPVLAAMVALVKIGARVKVPLMPVAFSRAMAPEYPTDELAFTP